MILSGRFHLPSILTTISIFFANITLLDCFDFTRINFKCLFTQLLIISIHPSIVWTAWSLWGSQGCRSLPQLPTSEGGVGPGDTASSSKGWHIQMNSHSTQLYFYSTVSQIRYLPQMTLQSAVSANLYIECASSLALTKWVTGNVDISQQSYSSDLVY